MRPTNLVLTISCAVLGVAVLYGLARKQSPPPEGGRAVGLRPYDAARQARGYNYARLVAQGNGLRGTDPAGAEAFYRRAIALSPQPADAWIGLARATDAQGKHGQALSAYRKVYTSPSGAGMYSNFPSDVEALARYGTLCEDAGRQDEAVRACNYAAGRLNPKPPVALGVLLDRTSASSELRATLELVRGIALDQQGKEAESLVAFGQAARFQPDDARAQFYLGVGLRKAGRFPEARAALEKASALDTEGPVKAASEGNLRAMHAHRR